jgi:hypothetical protein
MAAYIPPSATLPIFDAAVFTQNDAPLTIDIADGRYLKFPLGQGTETLPSLVVTGTTTTGTLVATSSATIPTLAVSGTTTTGNLIVSGQGTIPTLAVSGTTTTGTLVATSSATIPTLGVTGTTTTGTLVATSSATISDQTFKTNFNNTIFNRTASTNPSGINNTLYGIDCGQSITSGGTNVGYGHFDTLKSLTIGSSNSAIGTGALKLLTTGSFNTAVGYNSLRDATPSNSNNTCLGANSGITITTGQNNTFIGFGDAGSTHLTASNSTSLGYLADCANFSTATAIGSGALNTANNQIMLGTSSQNVICPNSISIKGTQPIKGMAAGSVGSSTSSTGTVSFGYTFANIPIVVGTMQATLTTVNFSLLFHTVTTTGFSYIKSATNNGSTTVGGAGEGFNWIAIGT